MSQLVEECAFYLFYLVLVTNFLPKEVADVEDIGDLVSFCGDFRNANVEAEFEESAGYVVKETDPVVCEDLNQRKEI